jgi:phage shock protein C
MRLPVSGGIVDRMTTTTLTRSDNRMIGGVCAGLAERYGWNPTTVRIVFLVSCILPGPQFLIYLALWIIMPSR